MALTKPRLLAHELDEGLVSAGAGQGMIRWTGDATVDRIRSLRRAAAAREIPMTLERAPWAIRRALGISERPRRCRDKSSAACATPSIRDSASTWRWKAQISGVAMPHWTRAYTAGSACPPVLPTWQPETRVTAREGASCLCAPSSAAKSRPTTPHCWSSLMAASAAGAVNRCARPGWVMDAGSKPPGPSSSGPVGSRRAPDSCSACSVTGWRGGPSSPWPGCSGNRSASPAGGTQPAAVRTGHAGRVLGAERKGRRRREDGEGGGNSVLSNTQRKVEG